MLYACMQTHQVAVASTNPDTGSPCVNRARMHDREARAARACQPEAHTPPSPLPCELCLIQAVTNLAVWTQSSVPGNTQSEAGRGRRQTDRQ